MWWVVTSLLAPDHVQHEGPAVPPAERSAAVRLSPPRLAPPPLRPVPLLVCAPQRRAAHLRRAKPTVAL